MNKTRARWRQGLGQRWYRSATITDAVATPDAAAWRALYYLALFRLFIAVVFAALAFVPAVSPYAEQVPPRFVGLVTGAYIVLALALLAVTLFWQRRFYLLTVVSLAIDCALLTLMTHAVGGPAGGPGVVLIAIVAGGALLLPARLTALIAALASLGILGEHLVAMTDPSAPRSATEAGLYGLTYFVTATLAFLVARRSRESLALAEQRGIDLANLEQLNALIIQRMRTGIMVVDADDNIRMHNESAWYLLGMPSTREKQLSVVAPELDRRLEHWRKTGVHEIHGQRFGAGLPAVVPRFTRLTADTPTTLLFLEDTSVVSQRAEEMTLASLGRLAASIAHEIRNPLGAISHAEQLLSESDQLSESDRKFAAIINKHCARMNEIIENVLQLSRRDRAKPVNLPMLAVVDEFVEEFRASGELGKGEISASVEPATIQITADPGQLRQVLWNLAHNAVQHAGDVDHPVTISLRGGHVGKNRTIVLDVLDNGPGISPEVVPNIFQPFFTSHAQGSGLGLYLAQQICEANGATLSYLPTPAQGACFRIGFPAPRPEASL